jgi:hypothetical protein
MKRTFFHTIITVTLCITVIWLCVGNVKADAVASPQTGYVIDGSMCHLSMTNTFNDKRLRSQGYNGIITDIRQGTPQVLGDNKIQQIAYVTYEIPMDFWTGYSVTDWPITYYDGSPNHSPMHTFDWMYLTPYSCQYGPAWITQWSAETPIPVTATYNSVYINFGDISNLGYNTQIHLAASIYNPDLSRTDFTTQDGYSLSTNSLTASVVSIVALNSTVTPLGGNMVLKEGITKSTGVAAKVTEGYNPAQTAAAEGSDLQLFLDEYNLGFRQLPAVQIATQGPSQVTPIPAGTDGIGSTGNGFSLTIQPQINSYGSEIDYNYTTINYISNVRQSLLQLWPPGKAGNFPPNAPGPFIMKDKVIPAISRPVAYDITNFQERVWWRVIMKVACDQVITGSNVNAVTVGKFAIQFGEMFWYYTIGGVIGVIVPITPPPPNLWDTLWYWIEVILIACLGIIAAGAMLYFYTKGKASGKIKAKVMGNETKFKKV